ncbi:MAG: Fur family transcriptional regulator [Desulfobacteraceae bacterium]
MNDVINKLKQSHISVTPQRLEILKAILAHHDHPSAEVLYQEVRQTLPMISFNTVYKSLETFCQKGLIIKINPLHEVARYDGNVRPHAHLVCTRCFRVEDVDWEWPEELPFPEGIEGPFKVERVSVQLLGICSACQQELNSAASRYGKKSIRSP